MRSKFIFLDFDGVLNHRAFRSPEAKDRPRWQRSPWRRRPLSLDEFMLRRTDPACIERLNTITSLTGSKIVLSTSWRQAAPWSEMADAMARRGIEGTVVGRTPLPEERNGAIFERYEGHPQQDGEPYPRGYEIQQWIEEQRFEVAPSFVILDDDDDMQPNENRLVLTSYDDGGLQLSHVWKSVELLG